MATTTRRRPVRRPPKRAVTITLGPPHGSRGRGHHPAPLWLIFFWIGRWAARWGWRSSAWLVRQCYRRGAGHVDRACQAWASWSNTRAAYGFRTPLVYDMTSDRLHDARTVELDSPRDLDYERAGTPHAADPQVRAKHADDRAARRERMQQADIDNLSRRGRPPAWQQRLVAVGLWRIDWEAERISREARLRILADRRQREADAYTAFRGEPTYSPPNGKVLT